MWNQLEESLDTRIFHELVCCVVRTTCVDVFLFGLPDFAHTRRAERKQANPAPCPAPRLPVYTSDVNSNVPCPLSYSHGATIRSVDLARRAGAHRALPTAGTIVS